MKTFKLRLGTSVLQPQGEVTLHLHLVLFSPWKLVLELLGVAQWHNCRKSVLSTVDSGDSGSSTATE
jgi:hypothetical protein